MRAVAAFWAILGRDLLVLRHGLMGFIIQVAVQPLLLVFTFTYVLPHVTGSGLSGYGTLLMPGLIVATAFSTGISAVTTPLALDLGGSREIDDRALAPISIRAVAVEKILVGAVYAWISGLLVIPIALLVSADPIDLHAESWPGLVVAIVLVGLTTSALGLVIGTLVKPHQIGMLYGVFVIPVQFLGCTYYDRGGPGTAYARGLVTAAHGHDTYPTRARHLHHGESDATGCAGDEQRVPLCDRATLQHSEGGAVGDGQRGQLDVAERGIVDAVDAGGRDHDILGEAPVPLAAKYVDR